MNKLPQCAVLALFLLTTSAQMTQCYPPTNASSFWQWYFWGDKDELINHHLADLTNDLIGKPHDRMSSSIPENDVINLQIMCWKTLNTLSYEKLQDKNYTHQVIGGVMQEYVEETAKTIAQTLIQDNSQVNAIANSIGNSFGTRLENNPDRNGKELQEFFGRKLIEKVQGSVLNPTYEQYYYKPHNQSQYR